MTTVILPTIGRVMWLYESSEQEADKNYQPLAAMVAYVHSDKMVNVGYLRADGHHCPQTSVPVVQAGEIPPAKGAYVKWMPYQQGQAAKEAAATPVKSAGLAPIAPKPAAAAPAPAATPPQQPAAPATEPPKQP